MLNSINFKYEAFRDRLNSVEFGYQKDDVFVEPMEKNTSHRFTIHYLRYFCKIEIHQTLANTHGFIRERTPGRVQDILLSPEEATDLVKFISDELEKENAALIEELKSI